MFAGASKHPCDAQETKGTDKRSHEAVRLCLPFLFDADHHRHLRLPRQGLINPAFTVGRQNHQALMVLDALQEMGRPGIGIVTRAVLACPALAE